MRERFKSNAYQCSDKPKCRYDRHNRSVDQVVIGFMST